MSSGLVTAAYIVAAILFIFSLAGLSKQETAKQGCYSGVAGMAVALFVTVFPKTPTDSAGSSSPCSSAPPSASTKPKK